MLQNTNEGIFNNYFLSFILFIQGTTSQGSDLVISQLRTICLRYLLEQVNTITHHSYDLADLYLLGDSSHVIKNVAMEIEDQFCIPPFSIPKGTFQIFVICLI